MSEKYDVVVVGGGHAGICAAIAAAENGQKTVLIQDRPVLGGNASSECGVPAHGAEALGHNRNLRDTGILEDIRMDFYCKYSKSSDVPAYWDYLLEKRCRETKNLTLKLNTRMINAKKEGRNVKSIDVACLNKPNSYSIEGKVFIDGTGDANLGYILGAEYRQGRECKDEFNENYLGKEKADNYTLGCSIYGWAERRDFPVTFNPPEDIVKYDSCESLAHRAHTIDHIIPRVVCSKDKSEIMFFWWLEWGGELDVIQDSEIIYDHLKKELFGLWDHLKNHCEQNTTEALKNYELTRWSAFPLRRESRRLIGDYILNEKDVINGVVFDDAIGYGGWPMDDHPPMGIASKEAPCNQLFLSAPYTVPYRCCYSKDFDNLFMVGRCISVTHAALSSVRVMNTLGSIGEAIGIAASMCAERNISTRDLGKSYIHELQNRIIRRDLHLIDVKVDDSSDLARKAIPFVSSEKAYCVNDGKIGEIPLKYDTALQLPISEEIVDSFEVLLDSSVATDVQWEIRIGKRIGLIGDEIILSGEIQISSGCNYYKLAKGFKVGYGNILTVVLKSNKDVSWVYGKELTHTRWGVSFNGDMNGVAYHGNSVVIPNPDNWVWVNGNGRVPKDLALLIEKLPGYKRHSKLFVTPSFKISPAQKPFGASNLISPEYRFTDWTNIWISEKELPQYATLKWDSPITISSIELIFDTNLDYSDQRYGFPRGGEDYSIPESIEETVSEYSVTLYDSDGKEVFFKKYEGNIYRRRKIELEAPVSNIAVLRLDVISSGCNEARVFGIKVF